MCFLAPGTEHSPPEPPEDTAPDDCTQAPPRTVLHIPELGDDALELCRCPIARAMLCTTPATGVKRGADASACSTTTSSPARYLPARARASPSPSVERNEELGWFKSAKEAASPPR